MGRQKKVDCRICLKTVRSDNLKRHMQKHENKPPKKEVSEKIEYHSTVDEAALENKLEEDTNEFVRKLKLGRVIKKIMIRRKWIKASLRIEKH